MLIAHIMHRNHNVNGWLNIPWKKWLMSDVPTYLFRNFSEDIRTDELILMERQGDIIEFDMSSWSDSEALDIIIKRQELVQSLDKKLHNVLKNDGSLTKKLSKHINLLFALNQDYITAGHMNDFLAGPHSSHCHVQIAFYPKKGYSTIPWLGLCTQINIYDGHEWSNQTRQLAIYWKRKQTKKDRQRHVHKIK
jgi:hypothetical protein